MKPVSKSKIKTIHELLNNLSIEEKTILVRELIEDIELDEGSVVDMFDIVRKIENIKIES